ncbi:MAG: pyruvate ferredoxin oxidoreductase subunit gamma [Nitrososphaerota archaeon]|nr:pyruvate ferredoxin oxidoreductase subunit gamma [Candidatus Bathyarchaeota archaeon]MDW8023006.1 pyruvate ferredoxin oxidoreductase subunit gamma [Nitrososphaerota archaeon]
MVEVRWHGRGGQGAVTAAEIAAYAAIAEGKHAQAFPSFGPERRGAPVVAFSRFSDKPILIRSEIYTPDIVVVLDPGLLRVVNVTEGLKPKGVVIVNTSKKAEELVKNYNLSNFKVGVVNATRIALDILKLPIVNTAMLGSFARITELVKLESIIEIIKHRFRGAAGEKNVEAVKRAHDETVVVECDA